MTQSVSKKSWRGRPAAASRRSTSCAFCKRPIAARRARAFARLAEDPWRGPDIPRLGPGSPSDKAVYRNLFGED